MKLEKWSSQVALAALMAAAAHWSSLPAGADAFELTIVPSLETPVGELSNFKAADINDRGQVVGTARGAAHHSAAARFTPGADLEDLDPTGGYESVGFSINSRGTVLGFKRVPGQLFHGDPFLYSDEQGFDFLEKGKTEQIRTSFVTGFYVRNYLLRSGGFIGSVFIEEPVTALVPYRYSPSDGWVGLSDLHPRFEEPTFGAYANNSGYEVFVISGGPREGERPPTGSQEYFVRSPNGRLHPVVSPGRPVTPGHRPNGRGLMAGAYMTTEDADSHAYVWTRKTGLVSIHPDGFRESTARGANKAGMVFGQLKKTRNWLEVFVYTERRGLEVVISKRDVMKLAAGRRGRLASVRATDMNDRGEIVGYVVMKKGRDFGFYYSPTAGLFDLDAVLLDLGSEYKTDAGSQSLLINNRGEILLDVVGPTRASAGILRLSDG